MILAFNWTPLFLTKSHPVKNFADSFFAKFAESAYIDLKTYHSQVSGKSSEQKNGNIKVI